MENQEPTPPPAQPDGQDSTKAPVTPKVRKPRADKGVPKPKKSKKQAASRYLQMMYRLGTVEKTETGDNGEPETKVTWDKNVSILPTANDRETMMRQIMQLAQHPDTCDQFANRRIQLVAVLDEFTMEVEVQARAKVVR